MEFIYFFFVGRKLVILCRMYNVHVHVCTCTMYICRSGIVHDCGGDGGICHVINCAGVVVGGAAHKYSIKHVTCGHTCINVHVHVRVCRYMYVCARTLYLTECMIADGTKVVH